uniref:Carboxylic ester hydrolase n=1 Tax=Meteorus pulchricornis TaxID=51522 RepID=A0A4D6J7V8_9HYME|nr:carboxylesterase 19 [Meteorus pulchricornis]
MQNPIVEVHQGQLRGLTEKNINGNIYVAFLGIPYATPPVGDLRFKDCEPPKPWSGVRNARQFGDRCAHQDFLTRRFVGSDDCLYLNVYTPTLQPTELKAVMVWIHGGVYVWGSGQDEIYGPDYLIEKDVVLVTINYRLGVLGFLNVDDEEAPGNQGLKDQVQALRWIQQNIAKFGGDPGNVTICGDSAGASSVHYLTIAKAGQGLFHKAIMNSGVALNPWAFSPKPPMEYVKRLAAVLNKDASDVKQFVNYLRTLSTDRLIEAVIKMETAEDKIHVIHPFIPSVDSKAKDPFLTIPFEEAVKAGISVPCISGYVSHEGLIAAAVLKDEMLAAIDANPENLLIHPTIARYLKQHNISVDDMKQIYFGDKPISRANIENMVKLLTDIFFVIGLHRTAEIQAQIPNVPMYLYKFEYELKISTVKQCLNIPKMKGTAHGDELSFLFNQKIGKFVGRKKPIPGSCEHSLIRRFTELWTNFAKTGNPTPELTSLILVKWEPIDNPIEFKYLGIRDNLDMSTDVNIMKRLTERSKRNI